MKDGHDFSNQLLLGSLWNKHGVFPHTLIFYWITTVCIYKLEQQHRQLINYR